MTEFADFVDAVRALYAGSPHAHAWRVALRQSAITPTVTWELWTGQHLLSAASPTSLLELARLAYALEPL